MLVTSPAVSAKASLGADRTQLFDAVLPAVDAHRVWVTDVTYLPDKHGMLYLAVVLHLYSRRVTGHAIADHTRTELPLKALDRALGQRGPVRGVLHHSDRGSPYTSPLYQDTLKTHHRISSMSRRAQWWDNAVAESLFGTLKSELDLPRRQQAHDQVKNQGVRLHRGLLEPPKTALVERLSNDGASGNRSR